MTHSTGPRITVGVFDADESDQAVRWAALHAAAVGGSLHLVHAFVWTELDVNIDPISGMAGSGFRSAAHSLILDAAEIVRETGVDIPVTSEIVDGNAVPVLVEASDESDLLVLGGRGMGRLMTLIVGSKSLALAARSHCPVVVVRGKVDGRGPIGLVHHEIAPSSSPARQTSPRPTNGTSTWWCGPRPPRRRRRRSSPAWHSGSR